MSAYLLSGGGEFSLTVVYLLELETLGWLDVMEGLHDDLLAHQDQSEHVHHGFE